MDDILKKIVETKREEIKALKRRGVPSEFLTREPFTFRHALSEEGLSLIAEVKKASPSKGVLCADFNVERLARAYESGGARALSVLTDEKYFQGSLQNIPKAHSASSLPILRKDFILDPLQIAEARWIGADAVLLITAILEGDHLKELLHCAHEHHLDALVEVHDQAELTRTFTAGAGIIGINNRNLRTFEVSLNVCLELKREIPAGIITVAESGIHTREDARRLAEAGFGAMLVGESLVVSKDPEAAVKELLSGASK